MRRSGIQLIRHGPNHAGFAVAARLTPGELTAIYWTRVLANVIWDAIDGRSGPGIGPRLMWGIPARRCAFKSGPGADF